MVSTFILILPRMSPAIEFCTFGGQDILLPFNSSTWPFHEYTSDEMPNHKDTLNGHNFLKNENILMLQKRKIGLENCYLFSLPLNFTDSFILVTFTK